MSKSREPDVCWVQITSGRGPAECQYAVARLAGILVDEASARGLAARTIETTQGEKRGTLLSALVSLRGKDAERFAGIWSGSVLWICKSPYRPNHRRKNWFVGVDVFTPPAAVDTTINRADIEISAFRASGPGGQHVNTTDSAVRIVHRPSGVTVVAREERSQAMNRKLALARIAARLRSASDDRQAEAGAQRRARHDRLQRGDADRVFKGPDFQEAR